MSSVEEKLASLDAEYANAAATVFTPVDDGNHDAVVKVCRIEESKKEGDNSLFLKFELGVGESGKLWASIRLSGFTSEKALGFTKSQLLSLGYTQPISKIAGFAYDVTGRTVSVDVRSREYEGKTRREVYFRELLDDPSASSDLTSADDFNLIAAPVVNSGDPF